MPPVETTVECSVHDSFRVQQVAGLFDLPLADKSSATFAVEVPSLEEDWQIGCIVGPSGSGKSTIAHHVYGKHLYSLKRWPRDKAVIDGFGDHPAKEITGLLTSVGFSSPPAWVRPYAVLSNGEQFRCDLARAILSGGDLTVFDEFTSVVDRTVAKIGSVALAKTVRRGKRRFVAVTCHYDVIEWLQPDWVVDMATCQLARGCLQRPDIQLEIFRCTSKAWQLFASHHYLNASLHKAAQCYLTTWMGEPVAFCAVLPMFGKVGHRRISRIVTLPDFQGVGIGVALLQAVAELVTVESLRLSIATSHPAMIGHLKRDPCWRCRSVKRIGGGRSSVGCHYAGSPGRAVVAFEYVGRPAL